MPPPSASQVAPTTAPAGLTAYGMTIGVTIVFYAVKPIKLNDNGGVGNTASRGGVTHTFLERHKMQDLFQMPLSSRLFQPFACKMATYQKMSFLMKTSEIYCHSPCWPNQWKSLARSLMGLWIFDHLMGCC